MRGSAEESLFDLLLNEESPDAPRTGAARQRDPAMEQRLSSMQHRLWLVHQFTQDITAYIIPCHFRLRGPLDTAALTQALQAVWERHDALRTVFPSENGEPRRVVLPPDKLTVHRYDFAGSSAPEAWLQHYRANHATAFPLDSGPLFRVCLYRLAAEEHALLLDLHHLNGDGLSLDVIVGDLFRCYQAILARTPPPERSTVTYTDYVAEEAAAQAQPGFAQAIEERIRGLSGVPTQLAFAFDHALPAAFAHRGSLLVRDALAGDVVDRVLERGQTLGLSPFMVFLAAFGTLLHRHTGQEDFLVGVPMSLRPDERFDRTVGFFVNTCVVRFDFRGDPSAVEVQRRTREAVKDMLRCPALPLDQLVRSLPGARLRSRPPLVQATMSYLVRSDAVPTRTANLEIQPCYAGRETAMFELTLDVFKEGARTGAALEFSTDAWERSSAERMFDHYVLLLRAFGETPERPVRAIDLAPVRPAPAAPIVPCAALLPDLVATHTRETPERVALISNDQPLTYGNLATEIALRRGQLAALGLKPGDVLGLACPPGIEWTVTTLAALTDAIVVTPIDPTAPRARVHQLVQHSGAKVLWHDESLAAALFAEALPCRPVHRRSAPIAAAQGRPGAAAPDAIAYILYTSGTTGQPKGVRVPHGALAAHLRSAAEAWQLTATDRTLAFAPPVFDAFWEQLFAPLSVGATVLLRDAALWAPDELCARITRHGLTVLDLPPQYLRELLLSWRERPDSVPRTLRQVLSGGEPMPAAVAQAWLDGPLAELPLVNVYGPTEAVVTCTFNRVTRHSRIHTANAVVPIGRALPGRELWVLDPQGRKAGDGIPGELCVGGESLAAGYHREPALTERAFPWWSELDGGRWASAGDFGAIRLYRTGDRVRVGPDGQLEFLGRIDRQVKVRGFRIELGEIEAALTRLPGIAQAVVLLVEDPVRGEQLIAYCTGDTPWPSEREVLDQLGEALPAHMLPGAVVFLQVLPVNANGKIDVASLPKPDRPGRTASVENAPVDELEKRIAALWAGVLGRNHVARHDNFFDLGGHSLLLVRLHTRLAAELSAQVTLVDLFAHPTVARMAELVRGHGGRETTPRARTRAGDVAVIGMAGRFPGAADVDELWANLTAGRESIRFFTPEELAEAGVPETVRRRDDYVPAHGFLEGSTRFDAGFFGYTPKEAQIIDPQQRLFLQEAWHALEHAGYDPDRFAGEIGVFGGVGMNLYLLGNLGPLLQEGRGPEAFGISLANDKDFLTTRLSYKLNLRGPSVNVNTACSTSLVAIHLAAESLLRDECEIALAGGVTLSVPAVGGYVYQPGGIASPDGHCRAFADDSAGTVGGSGVALVVLKRLERALADGDTIHAVIKGSAINNDGSDKVGFTAPSVHRQRDVIRAALDRAGVGADAIQYIEAHGTGTAMGDPIEVEALAAAFAPDHPKPQQCYLGSIKSNIGHLDTAAGVAGFIKAACALRHGLIPASLHGATPNSRIDFPRTPFRIAQQLTPWPAGVRRRAGVSSFGIGGTNAHAILEEPPAPAAPAPQTAWCLPLSARTPRSLLRLAEKLARALDERPDLSPAAVWFTLAEGRRRFPVRAAVTAGTRADAIAALRALSEADFSRIERNDVASPGTSSTPAVDPPADLPAARTFAHAWLAGDAIDTRSFLPRAGWRRVPLPTYVFDDDVCWIEPARPTAAPSPANASGAGDEAPVKRLPERWFYYPRWERVALSHSDPTTVAPALVLQSDSADARRWVAAMTEARQPFSVVSSVASLGANARPAADAGPLVVWYLAALGQTQRTPADFASRLEAIVAVLRSLAAATPGRRIRLMALCPITGGADLAIDPADACLEAAAVVVPHEYSNLSVQVVRIAPAEINASAVARITAASALHEGEHVLAYSGNRVWRRAAAPLGSDTLSAGSARLKPDGVYLITGGLGGIGLTIARHLASSGARRLVLVSRRGRAAAPAAVAALERSGAQVRIAAIDVADAPALRSLVEEVCRQWGRIDGVIHAAGVPGGALLARLQRADIEPVLRPKVAGTLALAEALRGREPDFVLACSSLTATLGGPGQAAYAAANAWMDAFCAAQNNLGSGTWRSLQWDAWAEVGMAARPANLPPPTATPREVVREWTLSPETYWPWGEHRIEHTPLLPGTAYLELLAQAVARPGAAEFTGVALSTPLRHEGEASRTVRVLRAGDELVLESDHDGRTCEHARARIGSVPAAPTIEPLAAIEARCTPTEDASAMDGRGGITIEAGPRWQVAARFRRGKDEGLAWLALAPQFGADVQEHPLHPALLDVALSFHLGWVDGATHLLPWRYERMAVFAPLPARVVSHARLHSRHERAVVLDVDVRDEQGQLLVRVEGYTLVGADAKPVPSTPRALPQNPFALTPAEGVDALLRVLGMAEPVVWLSTVDWAHAARPPSPAALPANATPSPATTTTSPATGRQPRPDSATAYRAPATPGEKLLATVWAEVLGYDQVGTDDDLFDLGADSLTALQVSARLKELCGSELPMQRFFEQPTIAHVAGAITIAEPSPAAPAAENWEEGRL